MFCMPIVTYISFRFPDFWSSRSFSFPEIYLSFSSYRYYRLTMISVIFLLYSQNIWILILIFDVYKLSKFQSAHTFHCLAICMSSSWYGQYGLTLPTNLIYCNCCLFRLWDTPTKLQDIVHGLIGDIFSLTNDRKIKNIIGYEFDIRRFHIYCN